jgi:hypothetical protein
MALDRRQDVDDLPMLVDCPVQVRPAARYLPVRLIDEPPVTGGMAAWPGSFDELGGEALHPPVDGDVISRDTALGQQFPDVTVRQALPQVPADRDGDHLPRESETSEHRRRARRRHRTSLPPAAIDQRNRARTNATVMPVTPTSTPRKLPAQRSTPPRWGFMDGGLRADARPEITTQNSWRFVRFAAVTWDDPEFAVRAEAAYGALRIINLSCPRKAVASVPTY